MDGERVSPSSRLVAALGGGGRPARLTKKRESLQWLGWLMHEDPPQDNSNSLSPDQFGAQVGGLLFSMYGLLLTTSI